MQKPLAMDSLSLKYYPVQIVSILICLVAAVNFGLTSLWSQLTEHKTLTLWQQVLCIAGTYGVAMTALTYLNKYGMWKPYIKLLGLCDIRGRYKGVIISSYHYEDNPDLPHVTVYLEATIAQNLNGFYVEMRCFSDPGRIQLTSESVSHDGTIKKEPEGTYRIVYFYSNKGNLLHPANKEVGLTSHDGVCVLKFDPWTGILTGDYFTHERSSYGKITMEPEPERK